MKILFDKLTYQYSSPFAPHCTALMDVSFKIQQGEIIAVVGATGSGKTTLVQHFNGLLQPTEGKVLIGDIDISNPGADISKIRRKVGLVFQFPEIQLFEETVYDDIAFGPRNLGLSERQVKRRVCQSLEWMGLNFNQFKNLSPFHLSGGEKRRVAIAGILAIKPEVLILDEPTVNLDKRAASQVVDVISLYNNDGKTVVFVSHDMDLVARLASRIIVLEKGKVKFDGPKNMLFRDEATLKNAGLDLPRVCRFMKDLQAKGYNVRTDVYSVEEAKDEIERVIRKK